VVSFASKKEQAEIDRKLRCLLVTQLSVWRLYCAQDRVINECGRIADRKVTGETEHNLSLC
jgi:hypothetical protein